MADVELIFPAKKVHIKPFQLVNLLVTVVTALVTGTLMVLKVCRGTFRVELRSNGWGMRATLCRMVCAQARTWPRP